MTINPGASSDAAPRGPIDVFLCHNSLDKPLVRQVAEGLELEFGIPHFLDVYAIPTGEAFLPWIESALEKSSGCAIFLGANGWGNTHFWEAERALERYRRDPAFRLIPVALPSIRDEDMHRLGAGSLFSEINWADFRNGPVDPEAIRKLRAALLGRTPEASRAPSRLTPYLIRRDAGRWEESGRRDKSILYRGRQLREAEVLQTAQPDLVSGDAIVAFLAASFAAQTRRARIVAALAVTATVVITALAINSERARQLALARFVAAEARQAASTDTGLLLAVQATRISETPEAYGALLEKLDAQPFLRHMLRLGESEVMSIAFDAGATAAYAGQADGRITRIDMQTLARTQVVSAAGPAVMALDVDAENGDVWAGLENGRVRVYDGVGTMHEVTDLGTSGVAKSSGGSAREGRAAPILTLQIDLQRRRVAVGDQGHRLSVLDRARRILVWTAPISAQRVTSVSFSADGELLAAASSEGLVEIFDARDRKARDNAHDGENWQPQGPRVCAQR